MVDEMEYQNKLRAMASKLLMSEERERRHIAKGLHDEVLQPLAFLKLKIDLLKNNQADGELKKELAEIAEFMINVIDAALHFTVNLNCLILQESGLAAAIEDLLKKMFSEKHNIATSFNSNIGSNDFSKEQKTFLYKAVRELLANSLKHANPRNVKVSVSTADGSIIISVKDDGKGFDVDKKENLRFVKHHGFGLFSIEERFKDYGGAMAIDSAIGKGTER